MPDLDGREQTAQRSSMLSRLDHLAEKLIVLDEVATGVEPMIADLSSREDDQEQLRRWRERFVWQIGGFFEHYRLADGYPPQDILGAIDLAQRLLDQADEYRGR